MPERSFGRTVRYRRTKLGLSQSQLADLVGRSPSTIRSWEAEKSTPNDPKVLATLVAILGVDERTLFGKAGVEPPVVVETSPTVEQALATLASETGEDPSKGHVPKAIEDLTAELFPDETEPEPEAEDEGGLSAEQAKSPRPAARPNLRVVPRPTPAPVTRTTTTMTPVAVREVSYIEDPAQRQFYQVRTLAAVVGLLALVIALFWAFGNGLDALGSWWNDFFSNLRL